MNQGFFFWLAWHPKHNWPNQIGEKFRIIENENETQLDWIFVMKKHSKNFFFKNKSNEPYEMKFSYIKTMKFEN